MAQRQSNQIFVLGTAVASAVTGAAGMFAYFQYGPGARANKPSTGRSPGAPTSSSPSPSSPPSTPREVNPLVKYGFPSNANLHFFENYIASYDRRTRVPSWVMEHLTKGKLADGGGNRKDLQFKEDPSEPELFRAKLADYRNSGFDRGHMVPAGNSKGSQKAMEETFFLTNIGPQVGQGFNRDYWARLEQFVRALANTHDDVWVITGPLYMPEKKPDGKYYVSYQMIGEPPNVAVPTHYFKVVLAERKGKNGEVTRSTGAFIVPNAAIPENTPLTKYTAPVVDVERHSGLTFFSTLSDVRSQIPALCSSVECVLPHAEFWKKDKEGKDKDGKDKERPRRNSV